MANIVHLGKFSFPYSGGIETVIEHAAEGAVNTGHNVTVVGFTDDSEIGHHKRNGILDVRCSYFVTLASQPLGLGYLIEALKLGRKADIVHLHLPNMLAALSAIFLPKHIRLVVHWHSDVVGKGWLAQIFRWLEHAVLRRAKTIICTSNSYANASSVIKAHKSKVVIIPIGVKDHSAAENTVIAVNSKIDQLIGNRRMLLSIGRLVPYKGFEVLIRAVAHLPTDVVSVIVGDGPLRESLQHTCDELDLQDKIVLLGKISPELLDGFFQRANIFCLPSIQRSEAFGVVLVEAMSYGLPIVATEIQGSGVAWVNAHGVSGLNVCPNNPQALSSALLKLLGDQSLMNTLSVGSRRRFEEEFTVNTFVNRLMDVYATVLESH